MSTETNLLQWIVQNMPSFSAMGFRTPRPRTMVIIVCVTLLIVVWGTRRQIGQVQPRPGSNSPRVKQQTGLLPDYEAADMKSIHLPASPQSARRRSTRLRDVNSSRNQSLDDFYYLRPVKVKTGTTYRAKEVFPSTIDSKEKFTMIMQTYNRTDLLLKLLNHYNGVRNLDRILVVWNNLNATPPVKYWESLKPHAVEVLFLVQKENLMRNRLKAFPEIRTEAVLIMDDDIMTSAQDIQFGFRVWKQFRNRIVGWYPRKHIKSSDGIFTYGSFELDSETNLGSYAYSMVLIGAAFIHRGYLELFNSPLVPSAIHKMIDKVQNCDDLAMNVVISDYLARVDRPQCSGIYVKPRDVRNMEGDTSSKYRGMWHNPTHFNTRTHCLNVLANIYSGLPLQYCDMVAVPFPYPVSPLFTRSNII